uniref:Putative P1 n=1 Tax=Papaya virus Q TaxID=2804712 RepID=A0A7U0IZG7_9TOMB|nr:putative P1 [Papaya virus Q]
MSISIEGVPVGRLTSHAGQSVIRRLVKLIGKQKVPPSGVAGGGRSNPGVLGNTHSSPSTSTRPPRGHGKFRRRPEVRPIYRRVMRDIKGKAKVDNTAEMQCEPSCSYVPGSSAPVSSGTEDAQPSVAPGPAVGRAGNAVTTPEVLPGFSGFTDDGKVTVEPVSIRSLVRERLAEEATRVAYTSLHWDKQLPWPNPAGGLERVLEQTRTMMAIPGLGDELSEGFLGEPVPEVLEEVRNGYQREVGWERLHWRFGSIWSPSTKMASRLRGHFGVRVPSAANAALGEHWLLEQYGSGLDASLAVCVAVKLWLTPTIKDEAIAQFHPFLVGR